MEVDDRYIAGFQENNLQQSIIKLPTFMTLLFVDDPAYLLSSLKSNFYIRFITVIIGHMNFMQNSNLHKYGNRKKQRSLLTEQFFLRRVNKKFCYNFLQILLFYNDAWYTLYLLILPT